MGLTPQQNFERDRGWKAKLAAAAPWLFLAFVAGFAIVLAVVDEHHDYRGLLYFLIFLAAVVLFGIVGWHAKKRSAPPAGAPETPAVTPGATPGARPSDAQLDRPLDRPLDRQSHEARSFADVRRELDARRRSLPADHPDHPDHPDHA